MYHHLHHALIRIDRDINRSLSQNTWHEISERVTQAINDPSLMKKWRDIFDYVGQVSIGGNNSHLKHLISIDRTNTSLTRSCHHYVTTDKNGEPCWVDGMCRGTRDLIPDFTDSIPLGAVLAGIDQTSTLAAWVSFNDYKAFIGKELASVLSWFKNSVLTDYQNKPVNNPDAKWDNSSLEQSLIEFRRTTRTAFGDRKSEWSKTPLPTLVFPDLQFITAAVTNLLAINLDSKDEMFGTSIEFLTLVDSIDVAITTLSNLDPKSQDGF